MACHYMDFNSVSVILSRWKCKNNVGYILLLWTIKFNVHATEKNATFSDNRISTANLNLPGSKSITLSTCANEWNRNKT